LKIVIQKVKELKLNPENPRVIKDDNFKKLVKSIQEFPEMLEIRPIVVDKDNFILGGNMRFRAAQEAKLTEIPTIIADHLTEEQKKEFIIKDNVGFGEWDWDMLANEWDTEKLNDWGLQLPDFTMQDFSDKNKEIDIDKLDDEMVIKLKYNEDDYWKVKNALALISSTPEDAVFKLLKL